MFIRVGNSVLNTAQIAHVDLDASDQGTPCVCVTFSGTTGGEAATFAADYQFFYGRNAEQLKSLFTGKLSPAPDAFVFILDREHSPKPKP